MEVASLYLSPQHYHKNSQKTPYCNVHMHYFTVFLFSIIYFKTDIVSLVFCICRNMSDFATANTELGRDLSNVLLLVLLYVYHISSLSFGLTE
jgi:hypothetical protein